MNIVATLALIVCALVLATPLPVAAQEDTTTTTVAVPVTVPATAVYVRPPRHVPRTPRAPRRHVFHAVIVRPTPVPRAPRHPRVRPTTPRSTTTVPPDFLVSPPSTAYATTTTTTTVVRVAAHATPAPVPIPARHVRWSVWDLLVMVGLAVVAACSFGTATWLGRGGRT